MQWQISKCLEDGVFTLRHPLLIDNVDSPQEKWQKWGEEMANGDGFSPIK